MIRKISTFLEYLSGFCFLIGLVSVAILILIGLLGFLLGSDQKSVVDTLVNYLAVSFLSCFFLGFLVAGIAHLLSSKSRAIEAARRNFDKLRVEDTKYTGLLAEISRNLPLVHSAVTGSQWTNITSESVELNSRRNAWVDLVREGQSADFETLTTKVIWEKNSRYIAAVFQVDVSLESAKRLLAELTAAIRVADDATVSAPKVDGPKLQGIKGQIKQIILGGLLK